MLKLITILPFIYAQEQAASAGNSGTNPHKKFQYRYSFKGPQLTQTNGQVPFWTHYGHAIASEEQVRLTPSLRSRSGSIWSKFETEWDSWEIEIWIKVSGKSRIGADGLAIWFTEQAGSIGKVFGANDGWNGMMLALDSFDNNALGDNPIVGLILNDGTKAYDHSNDGKDQIIASCRRDYRNKVYPVKIKIIYRNNQLLVLYDQGLTDFEDYEVCARVVDVTLPKRGYFGASAATGGLADDHDVLKFLTYSLHEPSGEDEQSTVSAAAQEAFKKQKEELAKIKAENAKDAKNEEEQLMDQSEIEIKKIYEVTNSIHKHVQESGVVMQNVKNLLQATAGKVTGAAGGGVSSYDVNTIKSTVLEHTRLLNEMKSTISTMNIQIGQKLGSGSNLQAGGAGLNAQQTNMLSSAKTNTDALVRQIADLQGQVKKLNSNSGNNDYQFQNNCPEVSCATSGTLFVFTVIQCVAIIGIMTFMKAKEHQAKKFF